MKKKIEDNYFHGWKLGVFEVTFLGTVCGYFVGWKYRFSDRARNIREGLYFPDAKSATEFRDSIENSRNVLIDEHRQIG